jgi:hypothetical protein
MPDQPISCCHAASAWTSAYGAGQPSKALALLRSRLVTAVRQGSQMQDAIAVAAQPFEVARNLAWGLGKAKQQRLRKRLRQRLLLRGIGQAHGTAFSEKLR